MTLTSADPYKTFQGRIAKLPTEQNANIPILGFKKKTDWSHLQLRNFFLTINGRAIKDRKGNK